jgi:hypothetical protein
MVSAETIITINASDPPHLGDVTATGGLPSEINIEEGAVVVGNVIGIYSDDPEIFNIINVSGGSISESVIGGVHSGVVASSNRVNISGGAIGGSVVGIATDWGHLSESSGVHISGGTIGGSGAMIQVTKQTEDEDGNPILETITFEGGVVGAFTAAGNVSDNSIVIEDDAIVSGISTIGGTTINTAYGGFTEIGNATNNTVNVSSGTVGDAYSGFSGLGDVWENTFNFSGGTINDIAAGYTLLGESRNNLVNLTGGTGTINGDVSGGYSFSAEGVARHNTVSIDFGGTSNGMISGGRSDFGDTTDNEVFLERGNVSGITGGYADHGITTRNKVHIYDGFAQTVYGGYTVDGIVEENLVTINGATATVGTVAGGFNDLGNVSNNQVEILDVNGVASIYGGQSNQGDALHNEITVSAGTFRGGTLSGGGSMVSGHARHNSIEITGGSGVLDDVHGGRAIDGDATNNAIIISDSSINIRSATGGFSAEGASRDNKVTVEGGTVGSVYGGRAGYGDASGNELNLVSGRYSGTIAGGYSLWGPATGNTVTIGENAILNAGVLLYGGWSGGGMDSRSDNTLNLRRPVTVQGLDNFENYNFIIPPNLTADDTLVTVTAGNGEGGPIHLSGTQVMVGMEQPNMNLRSGDNIVLIDERGGFGFDGSPANTTSNGATVGLLDYEFDLSVVQNQLLASITEARGSEAATSLSEGFVSGVVLGNLGADAIAGPAMDSALSSVHADAKTGLGGFGSLVAGKSRYKTGSHMDMLGVSAAAGLAYGINYDERYITMGPFLEYGKGDYDSFSRDGEREIRGSGDSEYMGGGFLLRWDEKDTGKGRYFAEASFRVGRLTNDFSSSDILTTSDQPVAYDTSGVHYGIHFGYGGAWKLSERTGLDVYGKYFYSRGESDAVALSSGEPIHFDEVTSHRLRGGARLSLRAGQRTTLLFGGAYEHQLDGWVDATVASYVIDAPTLKGGTGIGEFILSYRPSATGQTSINVGVQGFGGKREGVAGNIFVRF